MKKCYIIAANVTSKIDISKNDGDLVITADGGYKHAVNNQIIADILLGDFDSLGFVPEGQNVISLPIKKDDTDTLAAVKLGLSKGYQNFYIYGGMGGRTDHTIANIQTLSLIADAGGQGFLISENEIITIIKNSELCFNSKAEGTVSVFAFGAKAKGVTIKNLLYGLDGAELQTSFPVGVSNAFVGKDSSVSVKDGKLLIVFPSLDDISNP